MGCGFNNMFTARALCPQAYSYSFDHEDGYVSQPSLFRADTCPRFLERITSGDVEVTADQFRTSGYRNLGMVG